MIRRPNATRRPSPTAHTRAQPAARPADPGHVGPPERAEIPGDATEHGIATHVSVLEGRFAAEAILQAAKRLDVDAIALGSHGRRGLGRALLGSVAEEVARKAARPVLIVHRGGAS